MRNNIRTHRHPLVAGSLLAIIAFAGFAHPAWAAPANTLLSNQASPSGYPAGSQIFDSATIQGVNPTGTITFKVYSPSDVSCASAPLFTTDTAVHGNGYYQGRAFVTNMAGTYRWIAKYNGDAGNSPTAWTACSDPAGAVTVDKRRPNLIGDASNVSASGKITHSASLSSASGPNGPGGHMTWKLYGPNDMTCANGAIFTTRKTVNGVGTYTSAPFTPTAVGTYQWTVAYSGDANNWWAGTTCTDSTNHVQVNSVNDDTDTGTDNPPVTSIGVAASPSTVRAASPLTVSWSNVATPTSTDWVALYQVGAPDSAVVAWKYTNGMSSGTVTMNVPWSTSPGNFEVRLAANNSYQRLATSSGVTVTPH